jgi:hypothetical protein
VQTIKIKPDNNWWIVVTSEPFEDPEDKITYLVQAETCAKAIDKVSKKQKKEYEDEVGLCLPVSSCIPVLFDEIID